MEKLTNQEFISRLSDKNKRKIKKLAAALDCSFLGAYDISRDLRGLTKAAVYIFGQNKAISGPKLVWGIQMYYKTGKSRAQSAVWLLSAFKIIRFNPKNKKYELQA